MYNDFESARTCSSRAIRASASSSTPLPAYPAELHALLGRADLTRAEWDAAMARYGVDAALLAYAGLNRRVAWWDPARWALVYRAHDARVFARRLPRTRGSSRRVRSPRPSRSRRPRARHPAPLPAARRCVGASGPLTLALSREREREKDDPSPRAGRG